MGIFETLSELRKQQAEEEYNFQQQQLPAEQQVTYQSSGKDAYDNGLDSFVQRDIQREPLGGQSEVDTARMLVNFFKHKKRQQAAVDVTPLDNTANEQGSEVDPEVFRLRERLNRLYNGGDEAVGVMSLQELKKRAREEGL